MKLEDAYAEALFSELSKKDSHGREKTFKNLTALLKQKGHESLLPRIAKSLGRIETRESKKNTVMVKIAKGKEEIPASVSKLFEKGEKPNFVPCEDENLIGGYVAEGKGVRVDASYKSALLSLYERIKS